MEIFGMSWLVSRRNQLLVGGVFGALAGGAFAHFTRVEQSLLPVLVGFALGQVVVVVAVSLLQPNYSLKRTNQSLRD